MPRGTQICKSKIEEVKKFYEKNKSRKQLANFLDISPEVITRIIKSEFNIDNYRELNKKRNKKSNNKENNLFTLNSIKSDFNLNQNETINETIENKNDISNKLDKIIELLEKLERKNKWRFEL